MSFIILHVEHIYIIHYTVPKNADFFLDLVEFFLTLARNPDEAWQQCG